MVVEVLRMVVADGKADEEVAEVVEVVGADSVVPLVDAAAVVVVTGTDVVVVVVVVVVVLDVTGFWVHTALRISPPAGMEIV